MQKFIGNEQKTRMMRDTWPFHSRLMNEPQWMNELRVCMNGKHMHKVQSKNSCQLTHRKISAFSIFILVGGCGGGGGERVGGVSMKSH